MERFNICIVRPPDYLWSSAFSDLADLIAYSLQDNGYQASVTENFFCQKSLNIVLGCHLLDTSTALQLPKDTIIVNTEQAGSGPEIWRERILHFVSNFVSWDYSDKNIELLTRLTGRRPRHFRIGYHPRLHRITRREHEDIDVLFYGAPTIERSAILDSISAEGLKVVKLFGVFGDVRDELISRSKIVLNLHQHKSRIFEIVRAHYLMNNARVIVSEFHDDTSIDSDYKGGILFSGPSQLARCCLETIWSRGTLETWREKSLHTLMQFDSKNIIADLLEA